MRHIASALAQLTDGGRLVAITGASCSPDNPIWTDAFVRLQERGRVVFTAAIAGAVFAKHGTTIETRLTVIDRLPADDATLFPSSPGVAPDDGHAGLQDRTIGDVRNQHRRSVKRRRRGIDKP